MLQLDIDRDTGFRLQSENGICMTLIRQWIFCGDYGNRMGAGASAVAEQQLITESRSFLPLTGGTEMAESQCVSHYALSSKDGTEVYCMRTGSLAMAMYNISKL